MKTFCYQRQSRSCGYACIKMMLAHFTKNKDYLELDEPFIEDKAPSLSTLMAFSAKYGLILKAYNAIEFEAIEENKTYPLLLILYENGVSHMVVLKKRIRNTYVIFDPARGVRFFKKEELRRKWSLTFLEGELRQNKPFKAKRKRIENPLLPISSLIIQTMGLLSLFAAFYLSNDERFVPLCVLLFALFALLQVASRCFLVKRMSIFDKRYGIYIDGISPKQRESEYRHYLDFKTLYFGKCPSLPLTVVEILFFGVLLSSNDPILGIGLAIYLSIYAVVEALTKHPLDEMKKTLGIHESSYLGKPFFIKDQSITVMSLSKESYKYANVVSYKTYGYLILSIVIALISGYIGDHLSLNHLLFSTMSLYFLGQEFEKALDSAKARDECEKETAMIVGRL